MTAARRVAFITGGAQGIGKAVGQAFLRDGYAVAFADADGAAGRRTGKEFAALGPARFFRADVAREADVRRALAGTLKFFGRLDVLVNNAGLMIPAPPEKLTLAQWNKVIGTNLTGPFLCAKHAIRALRLSRGVIINIASTRALMSEPHTEAYAASKGGVVALTHALAVSLGPAVRVHGISPGWIDVSAWKKVPRPAPLRPQDHAQHPAGRVGRPEDVAALAVFLAREGGFMTGEDIVIDGGMTRKMIYV
jgi:NAD(P)-dependent dehydrogenase (short-subunit alcohol dehydrogenase family)